MKTLSLLFVVAVLLLTAQNCKADAKVEEQVVGPEGKWLGCAISPKGVHVAVLLTKGSRFAVAVDGVEGPKVDQLIGPDGQPFLLGGGDVASNQMNFIPVLFSDDGAHSAYFARVGSEYVVVLDGKESSRGPITPNSRVLNLSFSGGGKHLFYAESDTTKGYRVFVDGKPGPFGRTISEIATSPDGAHYAYIGSEADAAGTQWTVLNGKQVKYFGRDLKFTANGALLSILDGQGGQAQILNGKPVIQAAGIQQVWVSPAGSLVATLVLPKQSSPTVLAINGKPVPGTEGIQISQVYFSPDGKRWAASCRTAANASFVLIDGKKGQEYQSISDMVAAMPGVIPPQIGFTPDSSKFFYVASTSQSFLVVEDEEWDGFAGVIYPVIGGGGKRFGFTVSANGKYYVVIDNKATERRNAAFLSFSPDGSRYAFLAGNPYPSLYLDGVEVPGITVGEFILTNERQNLRYLFSPDSKHITMVGHMAANSEQRGVFLDGKLVARPEGNVLIRRPMFTPDSQHLLWVGPRPWDGSEDRDDSWLYVDGKQTLKYAGFNPLEALPNNWEMSPEGVVTFVARTGKEIKRFRVTPAADTNIATMLAAAK